MHRRTSVEWENFEDVKGSSFPFFCFIFSSNFIFPFCGSGFICWSAAIIYLPFLSNSCLLLYSFIPSLCSFISVILSLFPFIASFLHSHFTFTPKFLSISGKTAASICSFSNFSFILRGDTNSHINEPIHLSLTLSLSTNFMLHQSALASHCCNFIASYK